MKLSEPFNAASDQNIAMRVPTGNRPNRESEKPAQMSDERRKP